MRKMSSIMSISRSQAKMERERERLDTEERKKNTGERNEGSVCTMGDIPQLFFASSRQAKGRFP